MQPTRSVPAPRSAGDRALPRDPLDWNLLVTAREGRQPLLRRALRPIVRLRPSGFRNVLVGRVPDPEAALTAIAALRAHDDRLDGWLGKALVIARTFAVEVERFEEQVWEVIEPFLDRCAGRRFHVRVERRGHKGEIHTHATEQRLGARIHETLAARGAAPTVDFEDPDVVIAVETIGDLAGVALVERRDRERFPFAKID
jgi:tRNA(Ser,Leu) C12 N-acetylase TAN1